MAKVKGKKITLKEALVPVDEQPYQVPRNWCWVFGKAIFSDMETKKPSGDTFRYIDIDSVDNVNQCVTEAKIIETDKAPSRASRKLHVGDTVFSMVRPYLKNIAYISEDLADCIASTGFYICTPKKNVDNKFLYQLMISPYVVDGLNMFMKGDNSPSVRKDDIEGFAYPLPPLAEQKRIVEQIENLFSKLDEAKEKAQAVVDGFETRKAAILHKAFIGELTVQWRQKKGINKSEWKNWDLSQISTIISGYAFSSNDFSPQNTVPCIKITNVGVGDYISDDYEFLPKSFLKEYSRFIVNEGDILISLTRSYINAGLKVCIFREKQCALLNQRVAMIKDCNISYIYYFLCSDEVLTYVKEKSKTTNQPNLSIKDLNNLVVPVAPSEEQKEIVRILDNLFAKEQQVKEAAEAVLDQIDIMKKSILARAFRGKLGTNNLGEESSIELLKQIFE